MKFDMSLNYSVTPYKLKTVIFLITRPSNGWKFDSFFWFPGKNKRKYESKFAITFVRIKTATIFILKFLSNRW